jgi:hypothetical protein
MSLDRGDARARFGRRLLDRPEDGGVGQERHALAADLEAGGCARLRPVGAGARAGDAERRAVPAGRERG